MTGEKKNPGRVVFAVACLLIFASGDRAQAQAAQDLSDFQGTIRTEPYRNPIIFTRTELDEKTGKPVGAAKVWVMEEDGSGLRQLTYGTNYNDHPALLSDRTQSPDGKFAPTSWPGRHLPIPGLPGSRPVPRGGPGHGSIIMNQAGLAI